MATIEINNKNLLNFGCNGKILLDELMPVPDENDRVLILRHNKLIYVQEKTRCNITCKNSVEGNCIKDKKRFYLKMDAENRRERRKISCSLRH
jgi:hypothetical protein